MVRYLRTLLLVLAFAAPVLAQDYPQVEIGFGYGNLGLGSGSGGRHSGFASNQAFNINSWLAFENSLGYYGLGTDPTYGKTELISNTFGGRVNYRSAGPVLYANAGFGGGWLRFPSYGASSNNSMAYRFGGGVDVPINDYFSWKVEVSRLGFHFSGWSTGTNVTTGIVLKITQ